MTTGKAPSSGTAGLAGGAGPEQNLHLDHDAAREQLGASRGAGEATSRIDQARDAVAGAASAVGETVSQVAGQARETARGLYGGARTGARDAYDAGYERFDDLRSRGYDAASSGRDSVERFVHENPLLVGVVGLAAGLLIGALLPRTRQEDRAIGRWADDARQEGVRYAREVTQRGRQFVDATVAGIDQQVREARDELREASTAQTSTQTPTGQRTGPSGRYQNH